jgi:two-component system KDP operon response regulator KdpE
LDRARILVVEDDDSIRLLLATVLEDRGHEVRLAGDGEEGLRAAHEARPDLVLLDLGLPGMHGTAVLDHLKADTQLTTVPVMVVSAWAEEITERDVRARGAADVMRKPFDIDELVDRAEAAISAAAAPARRPGAG